MMTMDESMLLARVRQLDEAALGELYDSYSPRLFVYSCRLLGDAQTAEECVAETFYRFLKAVKSGTGPNSCLQAYLYRTAHNWITDYYRRRPVSEAELFENLVEEGAGPESLASLHVEQEQVRVALMKLTLEQRQVILLKYYEGWENEAIAETLQKPVGAVKSLQHRALGALRRLLRPNEEIIYELNP
jgi:RNA polymerase sigma-70 factor (ECF subfamily)